MGFADFFCRKNVTRFLVVTFIIISVIIYNYADRSYWAAASEEGRELVVLGDVVGIKIDMEGVMVLGVGSFETADGRAEPSKDILKEGDILLKAGDITLDSKEALVEAAAVSKGQKIDFLLSRKGSLLNMEITPKQALDGSFKLGIWVRDSTQGLGTITFYDKETGRFGALGHGITDVDTGRLMTVSDGLVCRADITAVIKGKKGSPGELLGDLSYGDKLGEVTENNGLGVYGNITGDFKGRKVCKAASRRQVTTGEAYILSGVDGEVKKYSVRIESVNPFAKDSSKCMTIKITDKELIEKTGGIIQGMSGSPIIQNDRIVGAVTHVFLNNPEKGYGIFIENMM